MEKYAHADPSRLSGGQRQRVCIAGALAMEPAVLVLDEPSSLLDVRGRAAIMRVMGRLAAAGATLVHVTHFMDEALAADRVIVMQHGHVALEGTPDEVFATKNAQVIEALGLEMPFEARLAAALRQAEATSDAVAAPGAASDEESPRLPRLARSQPSRPRFWPATWASRMGRTPRRLTGWPRGARPRHHGHGGADGLGQVHAAAPALRA